MGGRLDQVDVLRADLLEPQQGLRQSLRREQLPQAPCLKHLVLAEYTSEIAAGKEHGPGAGGSGNAGLLIPMQADARNAHTVIAAAEATLDMAIDIAATGAKITAHYGRLPQTKLRSQ